MATLLTTFDPTNPTSGNFVATFNSGKGTLHIKNASPVDVGFSLDQSGYVQYVVQAGEPRDIPVPKPRMTINWSQLQKLNTNTRQIQSVVYVESYECGETIPTSQALARHVNSINIGFSATFSIDGAQTSTTILSLANPTNSTVNLIAYEATAVTSGGAGSQLVLYSFHGDKSLGTNVGGTNRTLGSAASAAHVTADETTGAGSVTGTLAFVAPLISGQTYNLLPTPDQIFIPPGWSILLGSNFVNGQTGQLNLKWTETPV